jgi:simple sugar transport system permease protein
MRRFLRRTDIGILIGCFFIFALFSLWNPEQWFNWYTLTSISRYTAILGLLAIGQTFVVLIREIDLSVGSVYGVVGIAFITLEHQLSAPLSAFVALSLALAVGVVNAIMVIRGQLSSMIVTLGGLFFYRGLVYVSTHGGVSGPPREARLNWFNQLLGGHWFHIENSLLLLLLVALLSGVLLYHTPFGNHLLAVGGNAASAESQGVPAKRVRTWAFIICSLFAGLSAVVTLANDPQTSVSLGTGLELESIASVVIGGTLLTGGKGTILGTVLGAFFFTAVRSEMIALGAPPSWYTSFVGIALLLVVTLNTLISKKLRSGTN